MGDIGPQQQRYEVLPIGHTADPVGATVPEPPPEPLPTPEPLPVPEPMPSPEPLPSPPQA